MDAELINVIAIDKDDGDTYVFLYADGCDVLTAQVADEMQHDPELDFDCHDVETVADGIENNRLERLNHA